MPSGGKRPGAGRPAGQGPYGEKTTTLRIPLSVVADIRNYLETRKPAPGLDLAPAQALPKEVIDIFRPDQNAMPLLLPLAGSNVVAGFPSPADDYLEDYIDLNQLLISERQSTFLVRVKGESMIDAGIRTGDLLIVDRSRNAVDGDVVIAILDGELTVKRLEKRGVRITLIPENRKFPPITIREGQDFQVWGIVTHAIHRFVR